MLVSIGHGSQIDSTDTTTALGQQHVQTLTALHSNEELAGLCAGQTQTNNTQEGGGIMWASLVKINHGPKRLQRILTPFRQNKNLWSVPP